MIARIWRGATRLADAEAYVAYLRQTGLAEYRQTRGNAGAWVLWREVDGEAEFLTRRDLTVEHFHLETPDGQ